MIVGGGGLKTTRAPEEDMILDKHVRDLQLIDNQLGELGENINLNDALFNLTVEID